MKQLEANKETEKLLSPKRRSKGAERQKEEGGISGKDIAMFGAEMIPGVGEAMAVKRTSDALNEKDYLGAGIEATAGLLGVIPGVGDLAGKALKTSFKNTRKAYKLFVKGEDEKLYPLFVDANKPVKQGEFLEANFPDVAFKGKRKEGSKESFYVPTKGAKRSKGEKTKGTGDSIIIPDEATRKKLINEGFITEKTRRTKEAPFGRVTAVAARPGWHASQAPVATHLGPQDLKISKKEAEKLVEAGVTPEAIKRRGNQFYVKRRAEDQVFAEVDMADDVDYQSMLAKEGKSDINDRVPKGGSYKYSDGQADSDQWIVGGDMKVNRVLSREETRAIQKEMGVVDLPYRDEVEAILGKKFAKGGIVMDDYLVGKIMDEPQNFAEGGMPVAKQMELFDEGGLMQEGGTVDPISGNDVPVGSTKEEVRDDIPAQLSEGEFVMPADVVRYHGLDKMMALRDEAKMGLQRMEDMGQMGNSDEATIPDDIPFGMDDLEIEDEEGENNFAVGGYVAPQVPGLTQMPSAFTQYTPQYTPYTAPTVPTAQPTSYTAPTQQDVPMAPTVGTLPTFEQVVPPSTGDVRKYVNEQGLELMIPFVDGKPVYPIPAGYKPFEEKAVETPTTPTTPTAPTNQTPMDNGDSGMTAAELAEQRQNFADIKARKEAAASLGYKNQIGTIEYLAGALIPGVSMLNKYDAGDIMPDGTIADGSGNTFDPITGERKSVSGGILGNMMNDIAGAFGGGTKAEDAKISPAAKAMGLSPASMAGLMTIAGNQSINQAIGKPTLAGGMGTAPATTTTDTIGGLTSEQIDEAVKAGLGTREEIVANLRATETPQVETTLGKTAVSEAAKAAQPATVTEAATKATASYQDLSSFQKAIVDSEAPTKLDEKAASILGIEVNKTDLGRALTPVEQDIVKNSVTQEMMVKQDSRTEVAKPTTDELTFRDIESRVAADKATQARTLADQSRMQQGQLGAKTTAQAQAEAGRVRESFPTRTESFTQRQDYQDNLSSYERQGYSPSQASQAASNKTKADDEARSQTGSPQASAVTDSKGNAVRSSSGSVVTSGVPSDDSGPSNDKIVCTAMNNAYGFGSFRQTVWLQHSKTMDPAYQKGYHRIFKPLIRIAYRNKKWYNLALRGVLEGIARRRTADIWMQKHGKRHLRGAIERAILEPLCYIAGKIK